MASVCLEGYIDHIMCTDDLLNYLPYCAQYEINPKLLIKEGEPIGGGYYGDVYRGRLLTESKKFEMVAVKTTKSCENTPNEILKKQRDAIRAEIKILAHVGNHVNVLQLKGAVTTSSKGFCMVIEYCFHKGLDTFLAARRDIFVDQICKQGTMGTWTQYVNVEGFMVVHRDLALRNVLLTADLIVKIADFGLSRQTEDGAYMKNTQPDLPFRWSAPEALTSKRTTLKADLWTYGILLWELFKLSAVPYQGKTQADMLAFLNAGKRLDHPEYAPKEIYQLMKELWQLNPKHRPPLEYCKQEIWKQLQKSCPELAERYAPAIATGNYNRYEDLVHLKRDYQANHVITDVSYANLERTSNCNSTSTQQSSVVTFVRREFEPLLISSERQRSDHEDVRLPLGKQDKQHVNMCNCLKALLITTTILLLVGLFVVAGILIVLHYYGRSYQDNASGLPPLIVDSLTTTTKKNPRISVPFSTRVIQCGQGEVKVKVNNNERAECWEIKRILEKQFFLRNVTFPGTGINYLFVNLELQWNDAENVCLAWNGHLTSILDLKENQFLESQSSTPRLWIGFTDQNREEGAYAWSDGSPKSFTNWFDEPKINEDGPGCAAMFYDYGSKSMKWVDNDCTYRQKFVCKSTFPANRQET